MNEILLTTGLVVFIIYAGFNIAYVIIMKRTTDSVKGFLDSAGGNLNLTLSAIKDTIENIRKISDDARIVAGDIRQLSHALSELETAVRDRPRYAAPGATSASENTVPE